LSLNATKDKWVLARIKENVVEAFTEAPINTKYPTEPWESTWIKGIVLT
jgi:hypothetical protein